MTPEPFPQEITIGKKYSPAMSITNQAEADAYFERCVQHTMTFGEPRAKAEENERANLGYFAGYYDFETRERVERLFKCAHPIYGKASEKGQPTAEGAPLAGVLGAIDRRCP